MAKPIFLDLEAKKKVGPWAQGVQAFVLDNEWTYLVWYFLPDLAALDDVTNALSNVGLSKLGTYERRLREMSEDDYSRFSTGRSRRSKKLSGAMPR